MICWRNWALINVLCASHKCITLWTFSGVKKNAFLWSWSDREPNNGTNILLQNLLNGNFIYKYVCVCVCVCVRERAQSCLTLHHSVDCSPPGSSVCGILQARILEWIGISFSRGSSLPRGQTQVSCVSFIGKQILYHCTTWKSYVNILSLKAWIFTLISVPPPCHLG